MSQALMDEAANAPADAPALEPSNQKNSLGPRWLSPLVLIAAICLAAFVYAWFWQHSRDLWWWMGHDRHAHYMYGLDLALDLRAADFVRLFHDFDRIRVWGPLHPLLVALVEVVGGPNYRLAVLPSVAGWVLTMWCAFLIPRRLLNTGGNAAGLLAAFFVAVSPAHRAFATDVMYESLGAGLSLAAIYFYLVVRQDQSHRGAVCLAATLSLLFYHKYNYWLLVIFGLTLGEFAHQPKAWLKYVLSLCRHDRLPTWVLAEVKHPLNWIALLLAGAALAVAVTGGGTFALGRWSISLQEPHNLIHAAYLAFFIRFAWWWWQTGRTLSFGLPPTLRTILVWHCGAVALWFILPKRLSYFFWYVGPGNSDQQRDSVPFMHGLLYYLHGLLDDYLPSTWGLYLFVGMLALVLVAWRSLRPGSSALVFFVLVATFLTCQHPMLKYRFMHSWIAAAWILGIVGTVFTVQQIAGFARREWRPWAAGFTCALIIGLHIPAFLEPGQAQEGGLKPDLPSPLRITDMYLPALADARQPTILSNVSARFLWTWTFIDHHRHHNVSAEIKNFKSFESNPDQAKHWLDTTRSDALVLIDIRPGTRYDWKTNEYVDLSAFRHALEEQSVWMLAQRWEKPEGVTITLWKKSGM
jgi:hypothetical protein